MSLLQRYIDKNRVNDADIELVSEFTCFVIEMIINYYLFTSKANASNRHLKLYPKSEKDLESVK
jgi:hypothetical protein